MQPTANFTLFPNLPIELRDQVWLHTVDWHPHVLPRPPIIELSVCHEARNALLRIYRPCFQKRTKRPRRPGFGLSSNTNANTERLLSINGSSGNTAPRCPYAIYAVDVLHITWEIWHNVVGQQEPLQQYLRQEAIENMQHVFIELNAWVPRGGGPITVNGNPPRRRYEAREILPYFGGLKTVNLANEPRMQVRIAPLDEEERRRRMALPQLERARLLFDDEVLKREKLALSARYREAKWTLVAVDDVPVAFRMPHFTFEGAKQWVESKAAELPEWSKPEMRYARLVSDLEEMSS